MWVILNLKLLVDVVLFYWWHKRAALCQLQTEYILEQYIYWQEKVWCHNKKHNLCHNSPHGELQLVERCPHMDHHHPSTNHNLPCDELWYKLCFLLWHQNCSIGNIATRFALLKANYDAETKNREKTMISSKNFDSTQLKT